MIVLKRYLIDPQCSLFEDDLDHVYEELYDDSNWQSFLRQVLEVINLTPNQWTVVKEISNDWSYGAVKRAAKKLGISCARIDQVLSDVRDKASQYQYKPEVEYV